MLPSMSKNDAEMAAEMNTFLGTLNSPPFGDFAEATLSAMSKGADLAIAVRDGLNFPALLIVHGDHASLCRLHLEADQHDKIERVTLKPRHAQILDERRSDPRTYQWSDWSEPRVDAAALPGGSLSVMPRFDRDEEQIAAIRALFESWL